MLPPQRRDSGTNASASETAGERLGLISLLLTLRRAIQAVAGTRDYYPFHHDEQFARENGAEGIFFNTMFLQAFRKRRLPPPPRDRHARSQLRRPYSHR